MKRKNFQKPSRDSLLAIAVIILVIGYFVVLAACGGLMDRPG